MQITNTLPRFNYRVLNFSSQHFSHGCIVIEADGAIIHSVGMDLGSVRAFYRALGFRPETPTCKVEPEVYIWEKYRKDPTEDTDACLQSRLIEYLNENSFIFRKKYGALLSDINGTCHSGKLNGGMPCESCSTNPLQPEVSTAAYSPAQARYIAMKKASKLNHS